jgi:dipeptidase
MSVKNIRKLVTLTGILSLALFNVSEACTTVLITPSASVGNCSMVAHSADCSECDSRIALVPHAEHAAGAERAVYGIGHLFPRQYSGKAAAYLPPTGTNLTTPFGTIPEVNETFAYWDSVYGLMNERGLAIGESSTSAKIHKAGVDLEDPVTHAKGPALFSIAALIQLAMERCSNARCAVAVIGNAAFEFGFYGESFSGGESLTITDSETGECWVHHLSPDSSGKSAVWVAQRVPEGHVVAIANMYVISDVDPNDPENFMYSENLYTEAISAKIWDGVSKFQFNKVYGPPASLPLYISLRLWRVFDLVAPSLKLEPLVDPYQYPFSVKPDQKLDVKDVMKIFRDHFEGTRFDMTEGILAGPYGNPSRVEGGPGLKEVPGQLTRSISIPRTAYTMLAYCKPGQEVLYYATDAPATSVFVPFLAKTLREAKTIDHSTSLYAQQYQTGNKAVFDRESAWWAFDFVANWMGMNYRNMSTLYVYPAIAEWQDKMVDAANSGSSETVKAAQSDVVKAWWAMSDMLIVRYNDGFFNFPPEDPTKCKTTGYPASYLKDIGFSDAFVFPQFYQKTESSLFEQIQREINQTLTELKEFRAAHNQTAPVPVLPTTPAPSNNSAVNSSAITGMPILAPVQFADAQAVQTASGFSMIWAAAMLCVGAAVGLSVGKYRFSPRGMSAADGGYVSLP